MFILMMSHCFRKVAKGDSKLAALRYLCVYSFLVFKLRPCCSRFREKKAKILDEVMEKETYKVAKLILDKFAPSRLVTPPRPLGQPSLRYLRVRFQNDLTYSNFVDW